MNDTVLPVSSGICYNLHPDGTQAPAQIPTIEAPESMLSVDSDQLDNPSSLKLPNSPSRSLPRILVSKSRYTFSLSDLLDGINGLETLGPDVASAEISLASDGSFIETSSGLAAHELKRRYDKLAGVGLSVRSPYAITAFVSQHGKPIYRIGHRDKHYALAASAAEVEERMTQSKTSSGAPHSPRGKQRSLLSVHLLPPTIFTKSNVPPTSGAVPQGRQGWFPGNYFSPVDKNIPSPVEPLTTKDAAMHDLSCPPLMIPLLNAHSLMESVIQAHRVDHFQSLAAQVISSVCSILSSTETLLCDPPMIRRFPALSAERRRILEALAIFSSHAREASEGNLVEELKKRDTEALLRLSHEVVSSMRTFLAVAEKCGVDLSREQDEVRTATKLADGYVQLLVDRNGHVTATSQFRERTLAPSGRSSPVQAIKAVSLTYDHSLSAIAAFIGQMHMHTRPTSDTSTPSLGVMYSLTAEVVEIVFKFCAIADALIRHPGLPPGRVGNLMSLKDELYYSTSFMANLVRLLSTPLPSTTSEAAEKQNIIQSATKVLKAGADCYSAINVCLELAPDKPLIIDLPPSTNDWLPLPRVPSAMSTPSQTAMTASSISNDPPINATKDEVEGLTTGFQSRRLSLILESHDTSPKSDIGTPSHNQESNCSDDPQAGNTKTCRSSNSSMPESIHSYLSQQNLPFSIQDLDPIYYPYVASLALRPSDASSYSSASSRTASTDYGLYYTRWALSQESIAQEQSHD